MLCPECGKPLDMVGPVWVRAKAVFSSRPNRLGDALVLDPDLAAAVKTNQFTVVDTVGAVVVDLVCPFCLSEWSGVDEQECEYEFDCLVPSDED